MMIKNDEDDQNNEHDEYDDELQETVRTLLEMWKKIETVHFFDLYKCHQNFLKLSRIASLSCFLTIEQQQSQIVDITRYEWICQYLRFPNR